MYCKETAESHESKISYLSCHCILLHAIRNKNIIMFLEIRFNTSTKHMKSSMMILSIYMTCWLITDPDYTVFIRIEAAPRIVAALE